MACGCYDIGRCYRLSGREKPLIPVQRPCLGNAELAAVSGVFDSGCLGAGPLSERFEQRLREYLGAEQVLCVNSGTSALHLALSAIHTDARRDEVIVPSLTFVATIQAIESAGLKPVFCEVQSDDLLIDVDDVFRRVTDRTCAILPVHFGGEVCDMTALLSFAGSRGLRVVEDAAHAFGSAHHGQRVGSFGDVTCFSFDPIKNITCGEGGAVASNDAAVADHVRLARNLGIDRGAAMRQPADSPWSHVVTARGWRCHLPDFSAAIGLSQLEKLETFRARKRQIVEHYDQAFAALPGVAILRRRLQETFPFFYVLRVLDGRRDALRACLRQQGIGSGVHYVPNHLQPVYAPYRTALPVTERLFDQIVTLPMFFAMTDSQVEQVITAVRDFVLGRASVPSAETAGVAASARG